jgi:DNA polymerase-3 subunit gamma/tau
MYQVIARKYRPQSFAELVNQEHVKTTLENGIAQNRTAHGYIFSGQRGTGKTTVARILARCLNCAEGPTAKPCGVCPSCLEIAAGNAMDVIEIDAASNRGINEMRELRENVRYRPARDRYKVFIIDEAHQITTEAFNALLKTLEEPPEWVIFVLCTTESHKIPATISSRCQQFTFRSVGFDELVARMEWICGQEGIEADAEALAVLAQAGEGSVRDSLSALDQAIACCGTKLDAAEVRALVGAFSLDSLHQVTEALGESNSKRMLEVVDELERSGRNLQHFCRELARYFRNLLVAKIAGQDTRLLAASKQERSRLAEIAAGFSEQDLTRYLQLTLDLFRDLQYSLQPRLHLEVGLLRLVEAGKLLPIEEALGMLRQGGTGGGPASPVPPKATPRPTPAPQAQVKPAPLRDVTATAGAQDFKSKLRAALMELGMKYSADALDHSLVTESPGEVQFTVPEELALSMKQADLQKAIRTFEPRPLKIKVTYGSGSPAGSKSQTGSEPPVDQDEVSRRALAHPQVQRFQELFDGQVRNVRNLKE